MNEITALKIQTYGLGGDKCYFHWPLKILGNPKVEVSLPYF